MVEDELPRRLHALGRFFGADATEPKFWAGDSLTLADVFAFACFEDLEGLFPGSLRVAANLETFRKQFAERPRIASYLRSPRRPTAIMYGPDEKKIYPAAHQEP